MLMLVNLNLFEINNLHFPLDKGNLLEKRLKKNQHYLTGSGDSLISFDLQDVLIFRKLILCLQNLFIIYDLTLIN